MARASSFPLGGLCRGFEGGRSCPTKTLGSWDFGGGGLFLPPPFPSPSKGTNRAEAPNGGAASEAPGHEMCPWIHFIPAWNCSFTAFVPLRSKQLPSLSKPSPSSATAAGNGEGVREGAPLLGQKQGPPGSFLERPCSRGPLALAGTQPDDEFRQLPHLGSAINPEPPLAGVGFPEEGRARAKWPHASVLGFPLALDILPRASYYSR